MCLAIMINEEALMTIKDNQNYEHLSDDDMRDLLIERAYLQKLPREELIERLQAANFQAKTNPFYNLEIHPLSEIAKDAASPTQAAIKDIQGTMWWEWTIIAFVLITVTSAFVMVA